MSRNILSLSQWKERCRNDGEFKLASRYFDGGIRFNIGDTSMALWFENGQLTDTPADAQALIEYSGDAAVWEKMAAEVPERFHNDLMGAMMTGMGISRSGDPLLHSQYFGAAMRALELLRPLSPRGETAAHDARTQGTFDAPTGRYVHLELGGSMHRIYFEEAGQGIPILLQHTAGAHGSQWRHLFEMPEITSRFRLIAYDLPYHGKSIPPVSQDWWTQPYELKGEFLRSIPVALAETLGLENPVFMGCSVGGLLALDLAHKHPDVFRAVISVEGALKIEGDTSDFSTFYHPKVSNEYKARMMDGLMSPTSPVPYRRETTYIYASGWPPVFSGDLHYYVADYDLRACAGEIDTTQVGVHILSGEYDTSGRSEFGKAAADAIPGATWTEMKGVGHFPMSENPMVFAKYLAPILDQIVR